ncbi:hypothetical protein K458DRAFT_386216 [Lentithecium fluviatile CBS 122367]|uniref:Uncharacterized protein n=1 Tax=Lentithecium fluviatile CBS 122367 TaxID=1168545 RepID=A0A6G1JA38_9PLEO|nr:hypothetical protein K458DRAFT_386216 [Lentithecium fluviatile CBS 122367]
MFWSRKRTPNSRRWDLGADRKRRQAAAVSGSVGQVEPVLSESNYLHHARQNKQVLRARRCTEWMAHIGFGTTRTQGLLAGAASMHSTLRPEAGGGETALSIDMLLGDEVTLQTVFIEHAYLAIRLYETPSAETTSMRSRTATDTLQTRYRSDKARKTS